MNPATAVADCDVTAGFWPKSRLPMSPVEVAACLARRGIGEAWVVSARGMLFDFRAGNREALRWAEESRGRDVRFHPVGSIDLRSYVGWREEIREMVRAGLRLWRLFPEHQGWDWDHPGVRRVAEGLAEEGAVLFAKGKPGKILRSLGGARPRLLLGVHFYDLAEAFALWEEGLDFKITTQFLHGPGSIDLVGERWGAGRMVFGSGAPFFSPGSARAVAEASALRGADLAGVYSGNLAALLGAGA
jgi:predicted TIM-barrel fold metal-dependent hydrolase